MLRQLHVHTAGMGVGLGSAFGARLRNRWNCARERESAIALSVPLMCCSMIVKLCVAAVKNKVLTSVIRDCCHEVPVRHISTTAWLSQCTRRRFLTHWEPQVTAASSTAYSSFHWMVCRCWPLVQDPLSQWPCQ